MTSAQQSVRRSSWQRSPPLGPFQGQPWHSTAALQAHTNELQAPSQLGQGTLWTLWMLVLLVLLVLG